MAKKQESPLGIVILAAGKGTRMKSSLPKVLAEIGGRTLISHVLTAVKKGLPEGRPVRIAVVTGYQREKVEAVVQNDPSFADLDISFVFQSEQNGTGHAARCAIQSDWGASITSKRGQILVLPGDLPLVPHEMIRDILVPLPRTTPLRLLTTVLPDPAGYGRIVRRGKTGPVLRIVEERDANQRERSINEVATSIYLFQASFLKAGLQKLNTKNAQGELYLTDLISQASRAKKKIDVLQWETASDLRGVNNPWELSVAGRLLNERCVKSWALKGVRFVDPYHTYIDLTVEIGEDVTIGPGVILSGKTKIGSGTEIQANAVLRNVTVGQHTLIKVGTVADDSTIGDQAAVGPYAHLRPNSHIAKDAKVGNFVELKNSRLGASSKVSHLSYLGDAEVGEDVNIGCGFVTCNFDGRVVNGSRKHKTVIEDNVFMGSDCQTIAPVTIKKGSYVASGSTITQDVEEDALAIARARQVNKAGLAKRLRRRTEGDS